MAYKDVHVHVRGAIYVHVHVEGVVNSTCSMVAIIRMDISRNKPPTISLASVSIPYQCLTYHLELS